ncbi:acetate--CoA ligase family protein [Patescibacteria group bacterium]|nr:acetate--CoA ligase family protein [Patescibacteria group bacterium]
MGLINFQSAEKILFKYKIPICRTFFVVSEKEALIAAEKIGYPVFLKAYGKDILHRTDIKGVIGGINNEKELKSSFKKLMKKAKGVLVQETIFGKEIIIGAKRDSQFGPVVLVGLGGIFTEIIKDFSLRVAPVSAVEARLMLKELQGYDYLAGSRGEKPINFKSLVSIVVSVSNLLIKEKEIEEIDLNPVIANEKKVLAVDFKILSYGK